MSEQQLSLFEEFNPKEQKVQPALIRPRDYQVVAVDNIWRDLYSEGLDSTMVLMATGTGKTVTFATLVKRALASGAKRVLVLVHRDELLWQAKNMIQTVNPDTLVEVEAGDNFAERAAQVGTPRSKVVVAMKDSMWLDYRLKAFNPDEFDMIIVDECHHCVPQNKTYWNIRLWFKTAKLVGVTATADRTDELALGQAFQNCAFEYDILPAIGDGWLVPVVQQYVTIDGYDLTELSSFKKKSDFSDSEIASMVTKEKPLQGLAEACIKYSNYGGQERPTLVFTASVPHAKRLAEILNRRHEKEGTGRAVSVTNDQFKDISERRMVIDAYRMGEYRYLVNYGILTEGFDAPETRVVVIGRPTKSRMLYGQMVGRGTRPIGEIVKQLNDTPSADERKLIIRGSRKPSVLVIDPVGVSGVHKLVVSTADLLGGQYEEEVTELAKQMAHQKGTRSDPNAELIEAKRILEEKERARRRDLIIKAKVSGREVDPFDVLDTSAGREPGWFKGKEPTPRMKEVLEKHGIKGKQLEEMTFWKAKRIITEIVERSEKNLCTMNQARLLQKFGYLPEETKEMSFDDAKRTIDAIKANGWKRPDL